MEPLEKMKTDIILCECSSSEHQMIVHHDKEDKNVYLSIHLVKYGFWYRLKYGVQYIFGYKSKYGAFDEIILNPDDADKFLRIYETLKVNNEKLA